MAHKKAQHSSGGGGGSGHGDDDRPWVYFMIDAFFLCTQFFVITFKVKSDEVVLPQKMPPGGSAPARTVAVDTKKKLTVHVMRTGGAASYLFMSREMNLSSFCDMLSSSVSAGQEYQVRVSYEPEVPFQDVISVFNACSKVKIAECGLIPLRGRDAGQ
ncbi:MAG: biopolymer transporter ExbD [Planctomycetota bacterium]|nr:biopolymer transporter ExbD [Planctomycetota bacterium]